MEYVPYHSLSCGWTKWDSVARICSRVQKNVLWEINCFTVDTLWIRLGAVDGTRDPIICSDPFVINYIVLLLSSDVLSCLCLHEAMRMMMMCQVWVEEEILPFRSQSRIGQDFGMQRDGL